jgi:hypothetical protein
MPLPSGTRATLSRPKRLWLEGAFLSQNISGNIFPPCSGRAFISDGSYHFTDIILKGDFRPLREYQGLRTPQEDQPSLSKSDTVQPPPEEEEMLDPTQLSLFLEDEHDL